MTTTTSADRYMRSGIAQTGANKFPNPFFDIASEYMPTDQHEVWEWAEWLWCSNGMYKAAAQRVVRYFMTEVVLEGESDEERKDLKEVLEDKLKILTTLATIGDDFMVYGNVFVSMVFPFDRFLICEHCHTEYKDDIIDTKFGYKYESKTASFTGHCPKCNKTVTFRPDDRRTLDKSRIRVKRWRPQDITLRVHPYTDDTEIYWNIPTKYVKEIEEGLHFHVTNTPLSVLKCIATYTGKNKRPLYKFNDEGVYHFKDSVLAGTRVPGWAIPPVLPNFKLAYYMQILRRYDEAIALDYIVPFRVLFPDTGGKMGAGDAIMQQNFGDMRSRMQAMVANRRKDPTAVQIAPGPIGYQMVGGEAKALSPKDNMLQAQEELLNSLGYPAELFRGTMTLQAAPVALRLFEQTWSNFIAGTNGLLGWIVKRTTNYYNWGDIQANLRSVTLADDLERKALLLQGAAGMDISKGTAYKPLAIDYKQEQERIIEEQQAIQALQMKAQADQEAQAQALQGQMEAEQDGGGQGNAGQQGGPEGAGTPGDLMAQAEEIANDILFNTPQEMQAGKYKELKASNPELHALVKQKVTEIRQQAGSQGGAQVMQQQRDQARQGG